MNDGRCRYVVEGEPGRQWVYANCGDRWQIVGGNLRPFETPEEAEAERAFVERLAAWRAGGGWGPEPRRGDGRG